MKSPVLNRFIFILVTCLFTTNVPAGSQRSDKIILPIEDVSVLSKKVEKYAAERRALVFLIARQGRPASELPGYAIHNLYQRDDDPARSHLVVDFPINFLAGAQSAKVGVIIPRKDLQLRLLKVINSDTYRKLHNPVYSAIANPYNDKYQNCTEYVLDILNAAIYETDDVNISPLKLLLGSIFKSEIRTVDHKHGIYTATFGSIQNYLREYGLMEDVARIKL